MSMIKIVLIAILILLGLLLTTLLTLSVGKKRDCSFFAGKLFAHRGLHHKDTGIPENSLSAFALAKEQGYGVELDVQLTKDNQIVVFHDGNLKRVCGVNKNVWECTYDELQQYPLLNSEEKIPLFSDVLQVLGDTPIICEIKTHKSNTDLSVCPMVIEMIQGKEQICIESFNPLVVKWLRKHAPHIIRGQLSQNFFRYKCKMPLLERFMLTHLALNFLNHPDFIAYRHEDRKTLGFQLCRLLYKPLCIAWTVRSQQEQDKLWKDFDSVIFENYISKK